MTSVNVAHDLFTVAVPSLDSSLNLSEADFSEKFGFEKPSKEGPLVVHCLKGGRAVKGQDVFRAHGYLDVQVMIKNVANNNCFQEHESLLTTRLNACFKRCKNQ